MYNLLPRYSYPYLILHSTGKWNFKMSPHRLTDRKENKILTNSGPPFPHPSSAVIDLQIYRSKQKEREREVPERSSHQLLVRHTPCIN